MTRTQKVVRRAALAFAIAAMCWGSSQRMGAQTESASQAKGTPEEQAQKMKRMTTAERRAAAARAKQARAAAAAKAAQPDKKPATPSSTKKSDNQ